MNKHTLRLCALGVVTLFSTVMMFAVNRVYIEKFNIIPGEETAVSVMMENDENISSLQFDLTLPEGLNFIDDSAERNDKRISRTSHSLNVTKPINVEGITKRITIFAKAVEPAKSAIKGNDGCLLTFNVQASENFNGGVIELSEVIGSDATVVPAMEKNMENFSLEVVPDAGTYSLAPEACELTLVKKDTIDFFLVNKFDVVGLEAKLNLPEGVVVDEVLMGNRLSDNTEVVYLASSGKILISSLTNDAFSAAETPVFSIVLKGVAPCKGEVSLENVLVSNGVTAFQIQGTPKVDVEVLDLNSILFAQLSADIATVEQEYNDLLDLIKAYSSDEAKAWAESEEAEAINITLVETQLQLEADMELGIIDQVYADNVATIIVSLKAEIASLAEKAAKSEQDAMVVMGDVNGDGMVTPADANMILNYSLGATIESFVVAAADVNGDGIISPTDANEAMNISLGK